MKKVLFTLSVVVLFAAAAAAQAIFPEQIEAPAVFGSTTLVMPQSPLTTQIIFIGGTDMVETNATYGNPAASVPAKEWHDFIGFTPDKSGESLGWVSVNHEMVQANDNIGDGGGMTSFRIARDPNTDTLIVLEQALEDGRQGKFFAIDFANTVGETGMNCGGIQSPDGRIWTAEEWFQDSNSDIIGGIRDTADFTIKSDLAGWDGITVKKYQNLNWMVEVDPIQAKAIRKQYNWGRQPFEGGSISKNLKRVYLGPDATPGFFGMFIADVAGDFSKGTLYAYKHDKPGYKWVPIFGGTDVFLNANQEIAAKGATMYNRIEWTALDPVTGDIYWTETGSDRPGRAFAAGQAAGGVHDPYHIERAKSLGFVDSLGNGNPNDPNYPNFYGSVWKYDVAKDTNYVYIEGGAGVATDKHLSNPDGLNIMLIDGKRYMVIEEDLNGRTQGRMPAGINVNSCELWLLDMEQYEYPTVDNLIRLAVTPAGAEVTGCAVLPDGKSLLINAQHPSTSNPFPYNHSFTFAIHGFDKLSASSLTEPTIETRGAEVEAPSQYIQTQLHCLVYFSTTTDAALYN
ncbi:MAG: DUF839 domain-containing protein, partial [Saprospiraceae bacterium]|nr:DUF839 domain-containing protein [Saprospiraceae bacterium]